MTPLEKIFLEIESPTFAIEAGVASSASVLVQAIRSHLEFRRLQDELRSNRESGPRVLSRLRTLVDMDIDRQFENPYDVALSAYCIAIALEVPAVASLACEIITSARQTWWALQVPDLILPQTTTSSSFLQIAPQFAFLHSFPGDPTSIVGVRYGSAASQAGRLFRIASSALEPSTQILSGKASHATMRGAMISFSFVQAKLLPSVSFDKTIPEAEVTSVHELVA